MLFITPDNDFAGPDQNISIDYIKEVRETMRSH
jgi:ferredoxin-thioredoxin reductase catalytic chain